jgi:hypothetical protein
MFVHDCYYRYLPLLISKSYKSYVELKRKTLHPSPRRILDSGQAMAFGILAHAKAKGEE